MYFQNTRFSFWNLKDLGHKKFDVQLDIYMISLVPLLYFSAEKGSVSWLPFH